jgi:hypothetical protein
MKSTAYAVYISVMLPMLFWMLYAGVSYSRPSIEPFAMNARLGKPVEPAWRHTQAAVAD